MKQSQHSGRRHPRVSAAALAVLAAMSFAGAALSLTEGRSSSAERPSVVAPVTQGPSVERLAGPVAPQAEPPVPTATALPGAGAPQRVYIGSLGIDAPVISVVADGRSLDPPPDPQDLGWWADGARAGAAVGSALITGHTVHDGGGALDDLETLRPGSEIRVRTANGLIRYVAESVDVLDKDTIARRAPQLFSQEVEGRLVLVTCEGWDGTGYLSNVVVTAVPVT